MSRTAYLPNLGKWLERFRFGEIKRIGFTLQLKESGAANSISTTNAALLASWQELFNKRNFDADVKEKVVITPVIHDCKAEQGDGDIYENSGYERELRGGKYDIAFLIEEPHPDIAKQLDELEESSVSIYLFDQDGKVGGKKVGANLYPIACNARAKEWKLQDREDTGKVTVMITLKNPKDINSFDWVQILDGDNSADIEDETQFYSLFDTSAVVTNPAVTGCDFVLTTDRYGEGVTGVVFGEVFFYDPASALEEGVNPAPLAEAASLTENGAGSYTVNEAALLTASVTYELQIDKDEYDSPNDDVVVPGA